MYSCVIEKGKEGDFARSRVEGVDASVKDLVEVCGNIRRKPVGVAISILEGAAEGKTPILYRRNNKRLGHRRELGGRKGRYPKKSARIVLKALRSAIANAQGKGLSEELIVMHAAANKKMEHGRLSPKGRRNYSGLITARVEIVLKEKEGAKRPEKKAAKPKAEQKKPEPAAKKPAETPGGAKPEKAAPKGGANAEKAEPSGEKGKAVKAVMKADGEQKVTAREQKAEQKVKGGKEPLPGRKPVQKGK